MGGSQNSTKPAGPAGSLELPFALHIIGQKKETPPCTSIVPEQTPRGSVTIYDRALVRRGEVNRANKTSAWLNLNIAASQEAIQEENYLGHFSGRDTTEKVAEHLDWLRRGFGADFYWEVQEATGADRLAIVSRRLNLQSG